jgi:hypothetical protein
MLKNELAIRLYNWLADMINGDESYFSTVATLNFLENGTVVQGSIYRNSTFGRNDFGHIFVTV